MISFLYGVSYPFQQYMHHIQVKDSLGISLHLHSRMNIQMCVITRFGLAIDKPAIVLTNRAIWLIFKKVQI